MNPQSNVLYLEITTYVNSAYYIYLNIQHSPYLGRLHVFLLRNQHSTKTTQCLVTITARY